MKVQVYDGGYIPHKSSLWIHQKMAETSMDGGLQKNE